MYSNKQPAVDKWRPASEPPEVSKGNAKPVVVAKRQKDGTFRVYGAWYLEGFELYWNNDDEIKDVTGFFEKSKHHEYDDWFEPIDVDYWQPMPEPPTSEKGTAQ